MTSVGRAAVDPVGAQADAVVGVLRSALPADVLLAVCLYGSAVAGGLRPDSDLDLLGVIARPMSAAERRAIVEGLVPISWRDRRPPGWRPVELTLVVHGEVQPWHFPPLRELQYGEWLRDELLAGAHGAAVPDPDLAVLLTMARERGRPLIGPPPATLWETIPHDDLVRATHESLPALLADLPADTRNVLLTLARMWSTVETGAIRSKDEAARWAGERLREPHRLLMERARAAYLGELEDRSDDLGAARELATELVGRIAERGAGRDGALPPSDASV